MMRVADIESSDRTIRIGSARRLIGLEFSSLGSLGFCLIVMHFVLRQTVHSTSNWTALSLVIGSVMLGISILGIARAARMRLVIGPDNVVNFGILRTTKVSIGDLEEAGMARTTFGSVLYVKPKAGPVFLCYSASSVRRDTKAVSALAEQVTEAVLYLGGKGRGFEDVAEDVPPTEWEKVRLLPEHSQVIWTASEDPLFRKQLLGTAARSIVLAAAVILYAFAMQLVLPKETRPWVVIAMAVLVVLGLIIPWLLVPVIVRRLGLAVAIGDGCVSERNRGFWRVLDLRGLSAIGHSVSVRQTFPGPVVVIESLVLVDSDGHRLSLDRSALSSPVVEGINRYLTDRVVVSQVAEQMIHADHL